MDITVKELAEALTAFCDPDSQVLCFRGASHASMYLLAYGKSKGKRAKKSYGVRINLCVPTQMPVALWSDKEGSLQ